MNNFPIESSMDLFGSGLLGSCNSLFESQLNLISEMPLLHDVPSHLSYYSGEMQNDFNTTSGCHVSLGSTCEPAMTAVSQVGESVSDGGITELADGNATEVLTVAAESNAVLPVDDSTNVGSADISTEEVSGGETATDVIDSNSTEIPVDQIAFCDAESKTETSENDEEPNIDISISNVVCTFNTKCYLSLKRVALEGMNVEHKKATGMVLMKLRKPMITANIWASGKVTCTGSKSEEEARVAARRVARCLQRIYKNAKFAEFHIVNVLGTCSLPFGIRITDFSRCYPKEASYEPEIHPGVTYRVATPKATLKIFSTGSITVTAPRISNVQRAVEHVYPLVVKFRMDKCKEKLSDLHSPAFKQQSYFQQMKLSLKRPSEWCQKAKRPRLDKESSSDGEEDLSDDENKW